MVNPAEVAASVDARSPRTVARGHLLTVGSVVASGVVLSGLYATAGVGLPCPFKMMTGWSCPLCGGTRMGAALLHLDLRAAATYNPLALVGLVVTAVVTLVWLVQLIRNRRAGWASAISARVSRIPNTIWWVSGTVLTVGYLLLRNVFWPIPA